MFANRLTQEQRQAVLDLAANLASADNEVSEEELQYLTDFSAAFGLKYQLDNPNISIDDLVVVFKTRQSKIIALQELIKLSYKDGHFGREEQEKVFAIAQKFGLNNPELIMRIEKWVRSGFDWIYEGEEMLAE